MRVNPARLKMKMNINKDDCKWNVIEGETSKDEDDGGSVN